jgi:hypothetical protein
MNPVTLPPNYNSVAINATAYPIALARRVCWARRHPERSTAQRYFAEARDYLLHRRVQVEWSPRPPRRTPERCPRAEPPPCPTEKQIDAIFEQRRRERTEPQAVVYHLDPCAIAPRPQPSRRRRIPSVPKPREVPTPKPKPIPEPRRDVSWRVLDVKTGRSFSGPSLLGLAMGLTDRGIKDVTVWVAKGRHVLIDLSDSTRPAVNCGEYSVADLLSDVWLRHFLACIP